MDEVVPSTLQRLRAADIIHAAGLAAASLGQEYCRLGLVHAIRRQGARLSGIVNVQHAPTDNEALATQEAGRIEHSASEQRRYPVEVEVLAAGSWKITCGCRTDPTTPCSHAAALLYRWLDDPLSFSTAPPTIPKPAADDLASFEDEKGVSSGAGGAKSDKQDPPAPRRERPLAQAKHIALIRGPMPLGNVTDILALLPLNELRSIAREYEASTNGLNKQQLADAILEAFKHPEVVRRVVATLEKPQRQLLAALVLAGGSLTDDDLRGLFERFSLGYANQLQGMLNTLQKKGLLFRTNLHGSSQQRLGFSGSLLDVGLGWYVPPEVRGALHITFPITPFDMDAADQRGTSAPVVQEAKGYSLLADLLLVARALDGYRLEYDSDEEEASAALLPSDLLSTARATGPLPTDGSVAIPAPAGRPSSSLLAAVQDMLPRPPAFLRFAIRLLRLSDILYRDGSGTAHLRALSNAAQLLLGPERGEVARDLYALWLMQPGYDELFELQEHGLRLRCRAAPLHHSALRPGELALENSEAKQTLLALLAQAPLDQWINFPAFARFIYRLNPLFLQRRQRQFPSPHWWLEQEEGRPLRPAQVNDWLRAEGRYLAQLLQGPLHWLGLSDVALSADGKLQAFRLTSWAGALFAGIVPLEPAARSVPGERPMLEVSDAGNILISCSPAAWATIELVESFAEVAGIDGDRLRYRPAPGSLGAALNRGQHPFALLDLLRAEARSEALPDSPRARLVAQLERWHASYGQVRLYTGVTLLETADTLVMRELSTTTSLDEQVVRPLHATLAILKKPGAGALIEDLKRRGQVPLLHDEEAHGTE